MTRWTAWVLRHRRLVVAAWVCLALGGGMTATLTTRRLDKTFALPGRASFVTAQRVSALYHGEDGGQDPTVPVITAPSGHSLLGPSGRSLLRRVETAASLGGRYRVLGYGSTGSTRFLSANHRSALLLVFAGVGFGTADPTPRITAAVRGALPPRYQEATTGMSQLQSSTGGGGGNSLLVETVVAGVGARS